MQTHCVHRRIRHENYATMFGPKKGKLSRTMTRHMNREYPTRHRNLFIVFNFMFNFCWRNRIYRITTYIKQQNNWLIIPGVISYGLSAQPLRTNSASSGCIQTEAAVASLSDAKPPAWS